MKKNLFIAFEGIDGSGKSTQVKLLQEKLIRAGQKVYCTAEPTDSPIGSLIKSIFRHQMEADDKTIAALFVADRLDHLQNKKDGILKKMEEGFTVITDRYYFSSYAYHGTHMPMDWVIAANSLSAELLRPDLTIYVDVSLEESMKRLKNGRNATERYETMENLRRVREKYFEAFEKLQATEKIFVTDGNRDTDIIAGDIWEHVSKLIN